MARNRNYRERFLALVPEIVLRKLGAAVADGARQGVALCRAQYKRVPLGDVAGLQRYFKIQETVAAALDDLQSALPLSSIQIYQHEGSSTHYVLFESPQLRLAFVKVRSRHRNPRPRQRLMSRPSQPTLFDDPKMLFATLV
ncbi:MAG TPA: hypothetical protein VFO25_11785 [Candidatus Eremiobacteraceae bacterium]|nr:hypothetical protein [Candidatus Eremiobacteraceae bacterium]